VKPAIYQLLKKQAEWQQQRKNLPWAEKLRQSVILRQTGKLMREDSGKWNQGRKA